MESAQVDYTVIHPVPGLGRPVDYVPTKDDPLYIGDAFPTALAMSDISSRAILPLTTVREFNMLRFMNAITDKENWHVKILDDEVANKWKAEAIQAGKEANDISRGVEDLNNHLDADFDDNGDDQDGDTEEGGDDEEEEENSDEGEDNEDESDNGEEEEEEEEEPIKEDSGEDQSDKETESDANSTSPAADAVDDDGNHVFSLAPRDNSGMTEAMATYCIEELRHKARLFQESPSGAIVVFNGDVVKSDSAVTTDIKSALQRAVQPLEDVPELQKDWHPGSDEKVLDLVHPSLFPFVYGRTKALQPGSKSTNLKAGDSIKRCGEGEVVAKAEISNEPEEFYQSFRKKTLQPFSDKFQWLPCEVDVTGDKAKIVSYINNLHPDKHGQLYEVIEDVITAAIPLWEATLAPLSALADKDFKYFQRITYDGCDYDPDPDSFDDNEGPQQRKDEDEDDFWDRRQEWIEETRKVVLPEPDHKFDSANVKQLSPLSLKERFATLGRPLQVIVKLANIELTPEKPSYQGGTWHVEGKLNEHIVATALYYYSSSNITRSSLAFRQISDAEAAHELPYEQSVHDWLTDVFGCNNEEASVQFVGAVDTPEGRLLTFPNILQHQVQPFDLEDGTKPGHRKILALFLVDPHVRVISTASVPCQQLDWWRENVESSQSLGRSGLKNLPLELRDQVFSDVEDFPISLAEAKTLREELMDERKKFVLDHGLAVSSVTFSLCEH
ncbi:hypothetical protein FA15DRAFT_618654 [Coprinopsis marcescibilis]|uniref:Uncharacterized protein n=1 Tax=Coprinopsis marcescibilis TaxID=230819 RepID=A0A5C3KWC2_COPMA|nr:hypothetical protein FA15DRAFT_618654 [Coprinopsis marcescibilis]